MPAEERACLAQVGEEGVALAAHGLGLSRLPQRLLHHLLELLNHLRVCVYVYMCRCCPSSPRASQSPACVRVCLYV